MNIMDMEYLMCRNSSGIQEISSVTREFQVQINRYDGEGLRHEMEENGRLIKFLYNEDREVVAEENGNGTITRYIRGLGIISSDSEEAKTYYHYVSDEQGSITYVLPEDAEILNHYSYDAFGNIIEKTEKVENRFCYNGEMLDPVTQQYYLRARFYNPVIGRFTQEDTYYGDGLNLYQYCQANPVGYVDPSGHNICPTQLSLYKKYKEFFAKKMPEAEAKKKAYEYMRKKMGLTADNPFTEASEGGNKYNSGLGKKSEKYLPAIQKANSEAQKVVNIGNAIKAFDTSAKYKYKNPVTSVIVHENGTVSVGISGEASGNTNSFLYAQKLQVALNESAGYEKYKVSAKTDNALLNQIEVVVTGNIPGVCAEPKAATVAHYNKSKIVGMDTRYYTTKKVPHGHDGSNQMDACDTCKKNMEVYIDMQKINNKILDELKVYISCSDKEWKDKVKPVSMEKIKELMKYTKMDLNNLQFPNAFIAFICVAGKNDGGLLSNVLNGEFNIEELVNLNKEIYENWSADIDPMKFEFLTDEVGISYLIDFNDNEQIWYGEECVESSSFENFLMQCAIRQYEIEKYKHCINMKFKNYDKRNEDSEEIVLFRNKIIKRYGLSIADYSDNFFCYAKSNEVSMYIKKRILSYGVRYTGRMFYNENNLDSDLFATLSSYNCCEIECIK